MMINVGKYTSPMDPKQDRFDPWVKKNHRPKHPRRSRFPPARMGHRWNLITLGTRMRIPMRIRRMDRGVKG